MSSVASRPSTPRAQSAAKRTPARAAERVERVRWRMSGEARWLVAVTASIIGLWTSFKMDLPTGAAIVCASGLLLAVLGLFASNKRSVA